MITDTIRKLIFESLCDPERWADTNAALGATTKGSTGMPRIPKTFQPPELRLTATNRPGKAVWFKRPEAREPIVTRSVHYASRSGR